MTNHVETFPETVSIVGLGPSSHHYIRMVEAVGGRRNFTEETWVINSYGDVLAHDRLYHMDDIRLTMVDPDQKIQAIVKWLRSHPGPVYTSVPHPDFPGMVPYPLEDVLNYGGRDYLNNSAAYAIAHAVALNTMTNGRAVKRLCLFGVDFNYNEADSKEPKGGRACCEYWLGHAHRQGIDVWISQESSLLGTNESGPLYGYELMDVKREVVGGRVKVEISTKAKALAG